MIRTYKVGDLRKKLRESANQFNPVLGNGVNSKEERADNEKAYKDIMKSTSDYNAPKAEKEDDIPVTPETNQGMSDLRYDGINDSFKKKVYSQMKGYTDDKNEKIHKGEKLGNADYGTDKVVQAAKKHAATAKAIHDIEDYSGLKSREMQKLASIKKDVLAHDKSTIAEGKKIKVLTFKKELLMTEEKAVRMIPDSYKLEGNKFMMKDLKGNSYLVEWHDSDPVVDKKVNQVKLNEDLEQVKRLFNYQSSNYYKNATPKERLAEDKKYRDLIDMARTLKKK